MILVFLIVLIVALILANLFISIAKPKRKNERGFANPSNNTTYEPEVIQNNTESALTAVHEKTTALDGKLASISQKINLLTERIVNLEKAIAEIVDHKIKTDSSTDIDFDKFEFRVKVLEQQIDDLKNPKEKQKTFYGKLDPEMEGKVKSLAFNKKN